ncbi:MAG: hypothetical protein FWD61_02795 [Phycisphaerales bacterium]|nr:hypothetical protein [Phycisphaerales bacterium]
MAKVSLETVKKAQTFCLNAIDILSSAEHKLGARYQAAGSDWKDDKYRQLGDIVNECTGALRSPVQELQICYGKLLDIEKAIREYDEA